jgi:pimeloyl-ACP methyl ester carboxylesterase
VEPIQVHIGVTDRGRPAADVLGDDEIAKMPTGTVTTPPAYLSCLAGRFDPDAMDVPGGRAHIRLEVRGVALWDAQVSGADARLAPATEHPGPDALLIADAETWERIADDVRGGMEAYRRGRLRVRRNLHLGIGFLAATSGLSGPGRLRFHSVRARKARISLLSAGSGDPILCLHGLGGTKASFLPTVAALADRFTVIAMDFPGFGESDKPIAAPYDAPYLARTAVDVLDELGVERAHVVGNSMGGRVAIELGLTEPERTRRIVLLSPALAWIRDRPWKRLVQLPLPRLGLIQPTPRAIAEPIVRRLVPGGSDGWSAAGVDEFLRAYLTPRGRAAFYAAARNIYLDEPWGEDGFWTRLAALSPRTMFVWGRHDQLVPVGFRKHVERALPAARHVELECGHVPQVEAPRQAHEAIGDFLEE